MGQTVSRMAFEYTAGISALREQGVLPHEMNARERESHKVYGYLYNKKDAVRTLFLSS